MDLKRKLRLTNYSCSHHFLVCQFSLILRTLHCKRSVLNFAAPKIVSPSCFLLPAETHAERRVGALVSIDPSVVSCAFGYATGSTL
jgi:hypothetical protein